MPTEALGAVSIAERLKDRMVAGEVRTGEYLSSIRALSNEFQCAPVTIQRALRMLSEEGLVTAEPRRGYRVSRSNESKLQKTVAFIEPTTGYESFLGDIYQKQLAVLQREALRRGWHSVILAYQGQSPSAIAGQLEKLEATALIMQNTGEKFEQSLPEAMIALGKPVIGLDRTCGVPGIELVVRDQYHGAGLATDYLVRKGHRQIGWYGPLKSNTALLRFAGAAEVLQAAGIGIDAQGWQESEPAGEREIALAYLKQPGRPKAVLALWQTAAQALARAARELGLQLGRDLEIVGWALEEQLNKEYPGDCPELMDHGATITWSLNQLGYMVFNRLEERLRDPHQPSVNLLLPMKLHTPRLGQSGA